MPTHAAVLAETPLRVIDREVDSILHTPVIGDLDMRIRDRYRPHRGAA